MSTFASVDFAHWLTWACLAIGLSISSLVYSFSGRMTRRPRRRPMPAQEDMPWDDLLQRLQAHQQKSTGKLPQAWENDSPEELWQRLVCGLPETQGATATATEDPLPPGAERRASIRRCSNPIDVQVKSQFHTEPLPGLVINRSTGGLAILCDAQLPEGLILTVRAKLAPPSVPPAELQVRYCRPAGQQWIMGCQYRKEIPWNIKVWFG